MPLTEVEAIGAPLQSRWDDGFRTASHIRILHVPLEGLRYNL